MVAARLWWAHPTHWLISTQVDADRKLSVPGAFADRVDDERSSRLYLALKRLVEAENLDAIAIRCRPSSASRVTAK